MTPEGVDVFENALKNVGSRVEGDDNIYLSQEEIDQLKTDLSESQGSRLEQLAQKTEENTENNTQNTETTTTTDENGTTTTTTTTTSSSSSSSSESTEGHKKALNLRVH